MKNTTTFSEKEVMEILTEKVREVYNAVPGDFSEVRYEFSTPFKANKDRTLNVTVHLMSAEDALEYDEQREAAAAATGSQGSRKKKASDPLAAGLDDDKDF